MSDSGFANDLLAKGIIYFTGEVTQESMQSLAEKLLKLQLDLNFNSDVFLYINSPGGDCNACFGILDIIANSRLTINTYGVGEICSCGLLLFLAGKHRLVTPKTSILSHQYFWGKVGKYHELKGVRKQQDLVYKKMIRYYKERTGLSEKVIKTKLLPATDTWLTPNEALKYNIATGIIHNKKLVKVRKLKNKGRKR